MREGFKKGAIRRCVPALRGQDDKQNLMCPSFIQIFPISFQTHGSLGGPYPQYPVTCRVFVSTALNQAHLLVQLILVSTHLFHRVKMPHTPA
jgi:hypothetical protein